MDSQDDNVNDIHVVEVLNAQVGEDIAEGPSHGTQQPSVTSESEESTDASNDAVTKSPKKRTALSVLTPKAPKRPDHTRRCKRCFCYPMSVEADYNIQRQTPDFDSQLKHMEYERKPSKHLLMIETLLASEFLVGKGMSLKICLLRDEDLSIGESVIILLTQGKNEIRIPASSFLKSKMNKINGYMLFYEEHETEELTVIDEELYAEFFKDSVGQWVTLKAYKDGDVLDCIYLCAATWIQIKSIAPLMQLCTDHYTNLVLSGGACEAKICMSPVISKQMFQ